MFYLDFCDNLKEGLIAIGNVFSLKLKKSYRHEKTILECYSF